MDKHLSLSPKGALLLFFFAHVDGEETTIQSRGSQGKSTEELGSIYNFEVETADGRMLPLDLWTSYVGTGPSILTRLGAVLYDHQGTILDDRGGNGKSGEAIEFNSDDRHEAGGEMPGVANPLAAAERRRWRSILGVNLDILITDDEICDSRCILEKLGGLLLYLTTEYLLSPQTSTATMLRQAAAMRDRIVLWDSHQLIRPRVLYPTIQTLLNRGDEPIRIVAEQLLAVAEEPLTVRQFILNRQLYFVKGINPSMLPVVNQKHVSRTDNPTNRRCSSNPPYKGAAFASALRTSRVGTQLKFLSSKSSSKLQNKETWKQSGLLLMQEQLAGHVSSDTSDEESLQRWIPPVFRPSRSLYPTMEDNSYCEQSTGKPGFSDGYPLGEQLLPDAFNATYAPSKSIVAANMDWLGSLLWLFRGDSKYVLTELANFISIARLSKLQPPYTFTSEVFILKLLFLRFNPSLTHAIFDPTPSLLNEPSFSRFQHSTLRACSQLDPLVLSTSDTLLTQLADLKSAQTLISHELNLVLPYTEGSSGDFTGNAPLIPPFNSELEHPNAQADRKQISWKGASWILSSARQYLRTYKTTFLPYSRYTWPESLTEEETEDDISIPETTTGKLLQDIIAATKLAYAYGMDKLARRKTHETKIDNKRTPSPRCQRDQITGDTQHDTPLPVAHFDTESPMVTPEVSNTPSRAVAYGISTPVMGRRARRERIASLAEGVSSSAMEAEAITPQQLFRPEQGMCPAPCLTDEHYTQAGTNAMEMDQECVNEVYPPLRLRKLFSPRMSLGSVQVRINDKGPFSATPAEVAALCLFESMDENSPEDKPKRISVDDAMAQLNIWEEDVVWALFQKWVGYGVLYTDLNGYFCEANTT